jgi:asparagine synthase (glutamine-hydrolysing)
MFFFCREWEGSSWASPANAAGSLGLFAGHPADSCRHGADFFAELPSPRAKARRGWTVNRSPSGFPVLLQGWIDNFDELSRDLDCSGSPERIYGAAVERWGPRADAHVVGEYIALMCMADGSIRLSRSPWTSFPFFYHCDADTFIACSVARPIFAAGLPKRLRQDAIDRLIGFESPDVAVSQFEGIDLVPVGTTVTIHRESVAIDRWYDPGAIAPVRFRRDEDYVEAGNAMLAEAVAKAMKVATKPIATLSGGLDSSVVCDEILRQLPPGERLKSATFVPLAEWDGQTIANYFGDDGPNVREFARMHPQLDPIFVDNRDNTFLTKSEQTFLAGDCGYPATVLALVHLGVFDAAQAHECEWVLSAGMGNDTFSTEAPWAAAEFFRTGRWGQLWKLAASHDMDPRPMWRRLVATGIMPNIPRPLAEAIRSLVHGPDHMASSVNSYLRSDGRLAEKRSLTKVRSNIAILDYYHSQKRFMRSHHESGWAGGEMQMGHEQVYGIQSRDVLSYRPFVELCAGMPTDQFVRDGERRYLARRMARGRMPEAQRTEHRHGDHVVDWHARLTPMLPMLREEVQRIADHPDLGSVVDTDRMLYDLDNWSETPTTDLYTVTRLRCALPAAIVIRRFIDFESGRNPQ